MASVIKHDEAFITEINGGIRRVLSHTPDMMVVEIEFEKGAVGKTHTHPHVQSSYVKNGKFEYTVGDEKNIISEGDSITVENGELHGCVCLEKGTLIDVFSPEREDFLK